jgi:hypothetical protein
MCALEWDAGTPGRRWPVAGVTQIQVPASCPGPGCRLREGNKPMGTIADYCRSRVRRAPPRRRRCTSTYTHKQADLGCAGPAQGAGNSTLGRRLWLRRGPARTPGEGGGQCAHRHQPVAPRTPGVTVCDRLVTLVVGCHNQRAGQRAGQAPVTAQLRVHSCPWASALTLVQGQGGGGGLPQGKRGSHCCQQPAQPGVRHPWPPTATIAPSHPGVRSLPPSWDAAHPQLSSPPLLQAGEGGSPGTQACPGRTHACPG